MVVSWWRKNEGKREREMQKVQISYCSNRYCLLVQFPHQIAEKPYFKEILTPMEKVQGYVVKFKDLPFLSRILNDQKLALGNLPLESKEIFQQIASSKSIGKRIIDTVGPWRLRPHQMSAIDFFYRHGGRIILGDGWNMGKTVTTLAIMLTSLTKLFLVVCDAVMIYHWKKHLLQSGFWREQDIITEPKDGNIAVGCAIITYEMFLAKRLKFQRLRFVVLDEPKTEISCQYLVKNIEYLVIISRKGDRKFHELLPLILPKVKISFLKQRYSIDEDGPKAHFEELKAIKAHFLFGEQGVKWKKLPTRFKAVYLQPSSNFLQQIALYLKYGISKHQQEYTIYCQDENSKHFLESQLSLSLSKEDLSFIKYKDSQEIIQEISIQSTVIFTEPFNILEEQTLNRIIKHLQASNCKVQYFPYPHQGEPSLYPQSINVSQYLETTSKPLTSFKPTSHDNSNKKKIIVYYDCEQSQEQQASLIQEEVLQDSYSKERLCFKDGCFSMDMQIFICQRNDNIPENGQVNKQDSPKKDIEKKENAIDLNNDTQQITAPTQQPHQQPQKIDIPTKKQPHRLLKYKHKQRSVIKIRLHPLTSNFP